MYGREDIEKIKSNAEEETHKISKKKFNWVDGNGKMPHGWKMREVICGEKKLKKLFFLAPDGNV